MFDKLIGFSIKNKMVIGLFTIALIVWGAYSLKKLPIDALPDITNNQVTVITSAPTVGAEEIENFITNPLEISMSNLPDVKEIRSISRFGLSVITVVFDDKVDSYLARQLVGEKIKQAEAEIPQGMGKPEMGPITTGLGEIYQYTVHTKKGFEDKYTAQDLRTIQDWIVRRQLAGVQGITEVSAWGGEVKQYEVSLDPSRLNAMNVTVNEVFEALHSGNENTGGAYIEKGSNVSFIRGIGMVNNKTDIENIVIKTVKGMPIIIRNIGTVNFGSAPRYGAITRNGEGEVVAGITMMLKGENSSQVIENVKIRMAEIQKSLPEGVVIDPYIERSALVKRAIGTVEKNLIEGGLIVIFVLVLLLGNLRAGLVVASVIPLAMLFAISMMNLFGVSGNLMSLGAIDFGLIVDGAVIIIEATLHHISSRSKHFSNRILTQAEMDEEVYTSATKIRSSAAFGEIIIMIVYLPILALVGIEGKMFSPMAQTVAFAILGALILSLTYVPMASALFLSKKTVHKKNISDKIMAFCERLYLPVITKALKRKSIILIATVVLFVFSLFVFSKMGGEFIPTLEEGDFAIEFAMMQGTSLSQMVKTTTKAEQILMSKFPEVNQVVTRIGSAEIPTDPMPIERADIMVAMKDKSEWTSAETKEEMMEKMEEALKAGLVGANLEMTQPIQMRFNELMTGVRQDVAIKIYGEDMEVLATEADKVGKLISTIKGVGEPNIEKVAGLPQITVNYNREKLAQYGIKISDVNKVITSAFAGEEAGVVLEGAKKFDLVVRFDKNFRQDISDIDQLYILTDNGVKIPLNQVAEISYKEGPAQLSHDNTKRRIVIGFNVVGKDVETLIKEIQIKLDAQYKLPAGYNITYGGQFQNLQEAKARLSIAVPVALLLIFMLLFFTFTSFKQALLVFTAIPLSAIGGVFALYLRGMPFSISAGVGFIALFGVAVLNGIVLIGYFNQLKKEGMTDIIERVLTGTRVRLRPVIMTAAVASMGFLPMALSHGAGAEVQKPLATVVIGGLLSATLLTLIVLPILYVLFEKIKPKAKPINAVASIVLLMVCFSSTTLNAQNNGTLDEWISKGLKNNNAILASDADIKSSQYLQKTSSEIGKTNISLTYGQYNSFAKKDNNIGISQSIPFPTLMGAKSKLAGSITESKVLHKKYTEAEVVFNIKQIYYEWLFLNQRKDMLQKKDSTYKLLSKASALRYSTGESNLLEKSIAETRSKEIENELMQIENDKNTLTSQLKALVNATVTSFDNKELNEATLSLQIDSSLSAKNPLVLYMKQQITIADNQKRVEKNGLFPDITVGYFNQSLYGVPYGNDNTAPLANYGNRFQGFSAGISIPLWFAPQSAKIKSAEFSKQNAELLYKQTQSNAMAEIETAYSAYLKYQKSLQYYKTSGLPSVDLINKQSSLAFQKGEISYSQHVINLQQTEEIKRSYLQTLLDYNKSIIALEFLSGAIK
jgi:cobalt-zinc-cadmium resistance protein CzcA